MSTKIYDAYKYIGNIHNLMEDLCKIEDDYEKAIKQSVKLIIPKYIEQHPEYGYEDCLTIGIMPNKRKFSKLIREHTNKEYPTYEDIFCFNASAVIYPVEDMLLVQFFGFDIALFEVQVINLSLNKLRESGKLKDYHYQNQSDPWYESSELTNSKYKKAKKDWKNRKRVWNIVFDTNSAPNKVGLVKKFEIDPYTLLNYMYSM